MVVFYNVHKYSSQNGVTALWVASRNGHVEVVNTLLNNGVTVDVQKEVILTFLVGVHNTD